MKVLNGEDAVAELFDDTVVSTEGQQLLEKERQKLAQLLQVRRHAPVPRLRRRCYSVAVVCCEPHNTPLSRLISAVLQERPSVGSSRDALRLSTKGAGGGDLMASSMIGNATPISDESEGAEPSVETADIEQQHGGKMRHAEELTRRFSREGLLSNTSAIVEVGGDGAAAAGPVVSTLSKVGWRQRLHRQQIGVVGPPSAASGGGGGSTAAAYGGGDGRDTDSVRNPVSVHVRLRLPP